MLEEITIDGVHFMAARRAATLVGISPDYLTRWCREGLVHARRLAGGVWFVSVPALEKNPEKEARKIVRRAQLARRRREEHRLTGKVSALLA